MSDTGQCDGEWVHNECDRHPLHFWVFIFGLVIPDRHLEASLIEKEDFVVRLLLPLFFAISGLRMDVRAINYSSRWVPLVLVIVLACAEKVAGTLVVALFYKMPFKEWFTISKQSSQCYNKTKKKHEGDREDAR